MWLVLVRKLQYTVSRLKGEKLRKPEQLLETMTSTSFITGLAFMLDSTEFLTAMNGILQKEGH